MRNLPLPIVAIIGRPNVGKSRLFNRLTGKYQALVDDQPGVTRDRHYSPADWAGHHFLLVDTGGLIPGAEEPLNKKVWGQAFQAIQEADLLLCLFDGAEGVTPMDTALVAELRRAGKKVFYVVNKIDTGTHEKNLHEFSRLGCEPLWGVSAEHGRQIGDLLDAIIQALPQTKTLEPSQEEGARLSILGRPNVGKSTLLNWLAGRERVVVHEEPGTTRDSIDLLIERGGRKYIFVDTAGIKRKKQTQTRLDKFSVMTALRTMEKSQIVLYMLDSLEGLSHHDLHLLHLIWEEKRGLIVLVNKWDQMKIGPQNYVRDLKPQLKELQNIPILCISAKNGSNCEKIWGVIENLQEGMQRRFTTAKLNAWLEEVVLAHPLPSYKGREVKLFYGTQVGVNPPHVVFFANEPKGVPPTYRRYLTHQFEAAMDLEGVPLRMSFRQRS